MESKEEIEEINNVRKEERYQVLCGTQLNNCTYNFNVIGKFETFGEAHDYGLCYYEDHVDTFDMCPCIKVKDMWKEELTLISNTFMLDKSKLYENTKFILLINTNVSGPLCVYGADNIEEIKNYISYKRTIATMFKSPTYRIYDQPNKKMIGEIKGDSPWGSDIEIEI